MAGKGTMQGRTIAFAVPGRFKATATLDAANLVERVEATLSNPVLGDMAVTVSYADYRDFGGVKFPTKIRQTLRRLPGARAHGDRGASPTPPPTSRCRTTSGRRPIPTRACEPEGRRRRVVRDRRHAPQRRDRDEGSPDRRRGAAERRSGAGRHRGGAQAGAGQADQVPHRQPSPLRSLRRRARLRGRGRDDHHPRRQPAVLRADRRGAGDRGPRSPRASRAGRRRWRACATAAC